MICLQVGQAGSQIGEALFKVFDEELKALKELRYPYDTYRQLVVDAEHKTWAGRATRNATPAFKDRTAHLTVDSRGRGNNWAMGYYGGGINKGNSKQETEVVMDLYRRQMEGLDHYDGCLLMHSLSGGTGSGLGSRLLEEIRMEYPKNFIISNSVLAFASGETPLQHYNNLLSLTCLQEYADTVCFLSNDTVYDALSRRKNNVQARSKSFDVTIAEVNEHIALILAGLYLPGSEGGDREQNRSASLQPFDGWDLVTNVTPTPCCKMVHLATSVTETRTFRPLHDWGSINGELIRYLGSKPNRTCFGAQLTVRGVQDWQYWLHHRTFSEKLEHRLSCVDWNPYPLDVKALDSTAIKNPALAHSMTLVYNGTESADVINTVLEKARKKFDARAFLHWYEKYGGKDFKDVFHEAFEVMDGVSHHYQYFTAR